jgi:hypothetical protein
MHSRAASNLLETSSISWIDPNMGMEIKVSIELSMLTASSPGVPKGLPTAPDQGLLLGAT